MPTTYLRKYGAATTIDFQLYETDGTDLKVDAASATGDVKIMKDEGAEANLAADAFVDEGQGYSLALSLTEMQAARIVVYIVDQGTKAWLDKVLIIETYGNASAQHPFDLGTATVNLSSTTETQIDDIQTETNSHPTLAEIEASTVLAKEATFTHATYGIDKIKTETAGINAKTTNLPSDPADESLIEAAITAAHATTNAYIDTEVAAILAAVDTEVAAIKAVTDTLSLAAIADAVCDETLTAHSTADSAGLALKNLLKIGKNKWDISGTTFTIYDDNGVSVLYQFTLDSGTAPTVRTPI